MRRNTRLLRAFFRPAFAAMFTLLVGCSSGTSTTPRTVSNVVPTSSATGDEWTTYAHDQQRTGFESQPLAISKTTLSSLKLRWTFTATDQIYASPLVTGGLVIICTANSGVVYAIDAASGKLVWQRTLGGQIRGTPTIADGQIFVGTHLFTVSATGAYDSAPSAFYSLDLLSGTVRWQAAVSGTVRSTAVVVGGRVIVGIAGGDPPGCLDGGIIALDEASGTVDWFWQVNPIMSGGGSVWAPIAYDGERIIAGTGNACNTPVMTSDSTVALDPATGALQWAAVQQKDSVLDDDTGGGAIVLNSEAYNINKDGSFYGFDRASGHVDLIEQVNPTDGNGGWATPTSDGTTLLLSTGFFATTATSASVTESRRFFTVASRRTPVAAATGTGKIVAVGLGGATKWTLATNAQFVSYVAIANGMGFANIDGVLTAIDLTNGSKLWTYALNDTAQGGVAIVPSGLYTASDSGTVYAFTL